jgi:hypothetical protein
MPVHVDIEKWEKAASLFLAGPKYLSQPVPYSVAKTGIDATKSYFFPLNRNHTVVDLIDNGKSGSVYG